ncbi:hypothetical protein JTE90_011364 [Oedothorax gibbosus]|uniref:Uncharacterized protein n=1 Tax=Oedothorax gibbosus TaxID=931172 RepID=A0AAV6VKV7_9ARAC|nr:hypothetical protein JTE90_011364 [Oedothorax gibbosus]
MRIPRKKCGNELKISCRRSKREQREKEGEMGEETLFILNKRTDKKKDPAEEKKSHRSSREKEREKKVKRKEVPSYSRRALEENQAVEK